MKINRKLAAGAFTAATILGVGGGVAYAQTSTTVPRPTSVAPATSVGPATPVKPASPVTPSASSPTAPSTDSPKADAAEPATPETESATETSQPSDGPGGHADGPGDVQHEGGAGEL
jgi:hypothetical protein